jgi:hypothetical protein
MQILDNSTQEELFDLWCEELIKKGYIKKVLKQEEISWIILFNALIQTREVNKVLYAGTPKEKVKVVTEKNTLLNEVKYRPDRLIFWDKSAKDLFFTDINDYQTCYMVGQYSSKEDAYMSAVEVKAPPGYGGKHGSDESFRVKQKWVMTKSYVYVNKVYNYPNKKVKNTKPYLWLETFTPERYFYTDKKLDLRKISNWEPRTSEGFITNIKV